jgi:hypothetical protein
MEFTSANPSVVRSIRQRTLLDAWLRALDKQHALPAIGNYRPEYLADELADMMGFNVEGEGRDARFLITQEGWRLTATYGNEHIDADKRTDRYLDDAIGPARYARVVPSYRACVKRKRPTYSISMVRDADGKDVSYERLLLPFGSRDAVEQIVGSYNNDLMGIRSKANPVSLVSAVIDLDFVRSPANQRTSPDVIELS